MKRTRIAAADLEAIERAMVRIRRSQTRRTFGRAAAARLGAPVALSQIAVIDAVEEGPAGGEPGVTVGAIAARLGIDPSRASRSVAGAVDAGWVTRVASAGDGRQVHLELTARGRALAARVHAFRRDRFAEALADWSAADRRALAELLTRFVDALARE